VPWKPGDAKGHTHKANSPHKARTWAKIANEQLKGGQSEGSAIRIANAAVGRMKSRK
jgi:hypothetical protein